MKFDIKEVLVAEKQRAVPGSETCDYRVSLATPSIVVTFM
jgi:hypothetical protein